MNPLSPLSLPYRKAAIAGAFALCVLPGFAQALPAAVAQLETLAIDTQGHPRLRWQWPGLAGLTILYRIERRSDHLSAETACPAGESLDNGWCVVSGGGNSIDAVNGKVTFTDNHIRIDPADPTEYQYRVQTIDTSGTSPYMTQWASSCEVVPADPIGTWNATMNNLDGTALLSAADLQAIRATDGAVHVRPLAGNNFYALWDDRYIAVLGKNAGLVSLVQRQQGIEYVHSDKNLRKNPWADSWVIRLNSLGHQESTDTVLNSIGQTANIETLANGLRFTWPNTGNSGIDVVVTWTLKSLGSTGLHANIQALRSGAATAAGGIRRVDFPVVRGLGYPSADVYWALGGTGIDYANFPYKNGTSTLWNGTRLITGDFLNDLRMQFFGISRADAAGVRSAVYVGAEDANQVPKSISFMPNYQDTNTGAIMPGASWVSHYPINGTGQAQSSIGNQGDNYDVVMTPLCGGEERIAKRYRRFALHQSWLKAPASSVGGSGSNLVNAPTAARTDLNENVKQGVFWWLQDNGPRSLTSLANYAQNDLKGLIGPGQSAGNVNVGIHLYNWYNPPYGNNAPEYTENTAGSKLLDPVKTMADYISAVQKDGTVVMPYINALLLDITDRCSAADTYCRAPDAYKCDDGGGKRVCGWFTHEFLHGYTTPANLLYREFSRSTSKDDAVQDMSFGGGPNFAMANLGSPFWQAVTDLNAGKVFGFGSAGIYLDSFGAGYEADYAGLWNVDHQRPSGHGTFFRNDSLALAGIVRAKAQAHDEGLHFSAAEHFNEAFIRAVDLFTLYDDHSMRASPLAQLVYSDYTLFAGPRARDNDTPQARTMRYGRAFTWGVQPGLVGIGGICGSYDATQCQTGQNASVLQYLRTLASARQQLYPFLSYGEFMGAAEDNNQVIRPSNTPTGGWCVDQGCSRIENDPAPSIRAARWLSNNKDKAIIMTNTSFSIATAAIPVPANWRGLSTQCHNPDGSNDFCVLGKTQNNLQVLMPALSVRYISFN